MRLTLRRISNPEAEVERAARIFLMISYVHYVPFSNCDSRLERETKLGIRRSLYVRIS